MERSSVVDFSMGFNDVDFSDRVLRLKITRSPSKLGKPINCEVKTLNICSLVLAAKSPVFYKLFKNGMKESQRKKNGGVTVRIHHSEEAAFMDLLSFIYDKPLKATSEAELTEVLMAADKFEVSSCVRHCKELLLKFPLTMESAVRYIEHYPTAYLTEIYPLLDQAMKFLAANFRNFTKSQQDAAMELPLSAIKVVLGSNDLQVDSEDVVFDFALKWAHKHYPNPEERRNILTNRLASLICFQNMSVSKLKTNLGCPDFDRAQLSKLIVSALTSKVEAPNDPIFPRRVYNHRIVEVVHLKLAQPSCVVYFDLTKEDCRNAGKLCSQVFCVGGESFYLYGQCRLEQRAFGLYIYKTEDGSESCTLSFQFSVMKKHNKEFASVTKSDKTFFKRSKAWGCSELIKDFMNEESDYFIDGILHLRVDIHLIKA